MGTGGGGAATGGGAAGAALPSPKYRLRSYAFTTNCLKTSTGSPGFGRPPCPGGGALASHVARQTSFPACFISKTSAVVQELIVSDLHRWEMAWWLVLHKSQTNVLYLIHTVEKPNFFWVPLRQCVYEEWIVRDDKRRNKKNQLGNTNNPFLTS